MGRCGTFFCHEQFGITPDIVTLSKALSGGYVPVGAMLCSAAVSTASSVPWSVRWCTHRPSVQPVGDGGRTGNPLQAFEDEDILDRVERTGKAFAKALEPLVDRVRVLARSPQGKGLMIGLVFGEPSTPISGGAFRMLEALPPQALFSQMVVVPLFHRHRILTQVAADNMNIVKLLPPLIAGDDEVEQPGTRSTMCSPSAEPWFEPDLGVRQDHGEGDVAFG